MTKSYVAKRRLWLTAEGRHVEAGATVQLSDEAAAALTERGSVVLERLHKPEPEAAPVQVVAMAPLWSTLEKRDVNSGETFAVSAASLDNLIESGAVRLPDPEPEKPAKSKRKAND